MKMIHQRPDPFEGAALLGPILGSVWAAVAVAAVAVAAVAVAAVAVAVAGVAVAAVATRHQRPEGIWRI